MEAFADTAPPPPSLGQVLAAERERQGLSRADVAQRLHWSPLQVEAMETGDYERLPKGTFLRGFVRNYARLLGLDAEAVVGMLVQDAPRDPSPGIVVPSQNIRFDPLGTPTNPYLKAGGLALVAIALALAAIYWWIFIRPTPPAPHNGTAAPALTAPAPAQPDPIAQAPLAPPEPVVAREAPSEPVPQDSAPAAGPASPAESANAGPAGATNVAPPAVPAGGKRLRFRFAGESWVEVKDRGGRVLLSKLNPAGSEVEVAGLPPFTVVIGNAPQVTLAVDGRPFALDPHTKVAVARFTLE